MAEQLVANLAESFQPEKYVDEYHANLRRIIDAKLKGKKIRLEEPAAPEKTKVIDLMARLQESLAQGKNGKGKGTTKVVAKRSRVAASTEASVRTTKKRATRATRSRKLA